MQPTAKFIQGTFAFEGTSLETPVHLGPGASYKVPGDKRAQLIYMRAGNSSAELVNLVLTRDGKTMRLFPVGAKSTYHVSLAVLEDIFPESSLDVLLAAPKGVSGYVVLDLGLVLID